ncbi:hypothetical protein DFQ12_3505 [Sphingobacterium detergens]|uniref:Uncharacterized protein n=2 Tax=Sphingobacterium detergens TaxID=1145106 RepID=A0A420AYD7_SPHD1|nr:hypothetical protein DFQ12_3505 [Sphingobacterium detergens]
MTHFMKKIWLFFFHGILFLCFSCSKDKELLSDQGLKEIPVFLLSPDFLSNYNFYPFDNKLKLAYKDRQLSRITGGFLPIPTATGLSYHFTDIIYWDINVIGDRVKLEKKSSDKGVSFDERHELRYHNKLITERRINRGDQSISIYKYEYENNLLKKEYCYLGDRLPLEKTFYFNASKNLDSIVYEYPYSASKIIEIFTNYDQKPNKLRGLLVLEEFLPRALSVNNYMEMNRLYVDEAGNRSPSGERRWDAKLFN